MFWTEFGLLDQGGSVVFTRKKENLVSFLSWLLERRPQAKRRMREETVLGAPCRDWVTSVCHRRGSPGS